MVLSLFKILNGGTSLPWVLSNFILGDAHLVGTWTIAGRISTSSFKAEKLPNHPRQIHVHFGNLPFAWHQRIPRQSTDLGNFLIIWQHGWSVSRHSCMWMCRHISAHLHPSLKLSSTFVYIHIFIYTHKNKDSERILLVAKHVPNT